MNNSFLDSLARLLVTIVVVWNVYDINKLKVNVADLEHLYEVEHKR